VLDTPFSIDDVVTAARRLTPMAASRGEEALVLPVISEDDSRADT
jgi:hypothetical protein